MSDEETREKRRKNLITRNRFAKEVRESKAFRIKKVESKKKQNQRLTTMEWINKLNSGEFNEDD